MSSTPHAVVMGDLNLIRCFSLGNIPFIPVATTSSTLIHYSKNALAKISITDPLTSLEEAKNELIAKTGNRDIKPVLYYSNDQQLLMVSRYREELSQYFKFFLPDDQIITACLDKELFIHLAKQHELPLPWTFERKELNNLLQQGISYPCILKPTTRFLWRINGIDPQQKVILIKNAEELAAIVQNIPEEKNFVLQQFIPGNDDLIYSYHAYHTPDGQCLGKYCGKKVRCNPILNGYSSSVELVINPGLLRIGDEIVKKLRLYGAIKIDFKLEHHENKYYLLEINPRFNMWHYLGMKSGINLPGLAYQYLQNQVTHQLTLYSTKYKWVNFRKDFPSGLKYLLNGSISIPQWLATYFPYAIYDKFSWHDPKPGLYGFLFFLSHLLRRMKNKFFHK